MTKRSLNFPPRHAVSRARFFLERAEECKIDEREAFEAYLEAAIIFGRTALHRLKIQYGKDPNWDKAWWDSLLNDPSVVFFRDERDFILKEGPPKLGQVIRLPLLTSPGAPTLVTQATTPVTRATELYYFYDLQIPATVTVRGHLELLTQHVSTAEASFQT